MIGIDKGNWVRGASANLGALLAVLVLGSPSAPAQERRALLVGVSRYPALADRYQLHGPPNDVRLIRKVLTEKFGFPAQGDAVRTLSEETGNDDASLLPTRRNIEREFAHLAEVAQAGDDVVILMAGHGAQQPEQKAGSYTEPDRLDEIFLPRDVEKWEGDEVDGEVPNAIADNQISEWLQRICAKDARVWIIFDCCHSGDISRGIGERERHVRPDDKDGLAIPGAAFERIKHGVAKDQAQNEQPSLVAQQLARCNGLTILYACQPNETTVERGFPTRAKGECFGLLTYSLAAVLSKATGPLSYQELAKRIHLECVGLGRTYGPIPFVEGVDISRAVLGNENITRSPITVTEQSASRRLVIDAGRVHGITENTVLSVYPPAGEEPKNGNAHPKGHVRVTKIDMTTADVLPCEFQGVAEPRQESIVGGRCEIEELDFGELKMKVAVDVSDHSSHPIPGPIKRTLEGHLARISSSKGAVVTETKDLADAEWLLHWHDGRLYLVPGTSSSATNDSLTVQALWNNQAVRLFELGSLGGAERETEEIGKALTRIARASNLLRLTAACGTPRAGLNTFGIQPRLEIRRLSAETDRPGELVRAPGTVHPGDLVQVTVTNEGTVPFDLTLLYVDSGFGISSLFPEDGRNNRFQPGDSQRLRRMEITDATIGKEHLVAIAVSSEGRQPTSFTGLAQSTIERFRDANPARGEARVLANLLATGLYGEGTNRSAGRGAVIAFRMDTIPFEVTEKTSDARHDDIRP